LYSAYYWRGLAETDTNKSLHTLRNTTVVFPRFTRPAFHDKGVSQYQRQLWNSKNDEVIIVIIIIFRPRWLENYKSKLQNLFGSKPTLAGRHQQNQHAAKPN